jgi:hypothetical protein
MLVGILQSGFGLGLELGLGAGVRVRVRVFGLGLGDLTLDAVFAADFKPNHAVATLWTTTLWNPIAIA